jgi:hypothetical protein
LRDRHQATLAYEDHAFPQQTAQPSLSSFVPAVEEDRNFRRECLQLWLACQIQPKVEYLPIRQSAHFLINRSPPLLAALQELALEEGLGTIYLTCKDRKDGLVLKGLHVNEIRKGVSAMLEPPSPHFVMETKEYGERVLDGLREEVERNGWICLSGSQDVLIEFIGDSQLCLWAVHKNGKAATELVEQVFGKINFWIQREGYDNFLDCGCCCEPRNRDEGVVCKNGHFYCSKEACFEGAVMSQIQHLSSRVDSSLLCPDCKVPYKMKDIAAHMSTSTWEKVQETLVDKQVRDRTAELEKQFNSRLDSKVAELLSKYGNADARLKMEAKNEALKIRNTILNLCCPHCKIAYADFTGCMALQCATCEKSFCGYCHEPTQTSRGAHEHVRSCLLNETSNGSFYATPDEVAKAQRRYRTRKLKIEIRRHKKDLQNAIIIELKTDLKDLQIRVEALFEFGNLHGELF